MLTGREVAYRCLLGQNGSWLLSITNSHVVDHFLLELGKTALLYGLPDMSKHAQQSLDCSKRLQWADLLACLITDTGQESTQP